ncbi:CDGSH iron-sulfur domain-containing protein 3, mitochondrial isoform X2 [Tamandua tetradactyla]|uniref:CDGSH iron-sulfur domain-containing protein 3, mitochondrial isoform X2 n=1 Tax=Tamandua tetradactyla TaxID=48850 RepID=UPI004054196A
MGSAALILRPAARGAWKLNQRQYISSWLAQWFPKTPAKSVVALKTPIKVELVAGKTYRWCVCGRSKKQPTQQADLPLSTWDMTTRVVDLPGSMGQKSQNELRFSIKGLREPSRPKGEE